MTEDAPRHVRHQLNDSHELPSVRAAQAKRRLPSQMASRVVEALVGVGCRRSRARELVAKEAWLESDQDLGATVLWLCECGRGCRALEALGSDFDEMLSMLMVDIQERNAELQAAGLTARW